MLSFVEKARCRSQRLRPATRRNWIITKSERAEAGERISRGRHSPQSIRQAANNLKDLVAQLRQMAVGDENGRLRRAFYAAGVEA